MLLTISVHAGAYDITDAFDDFDIDARAADSALYDVRADLLPDYTLNNVTDAMINGREIDVIKGMPEKISSLLLSEFKASLKDAVFILAVIIVCSVVTAVKGSFAENEISKTADAVCVVSAALTLVLILKELIGICIKTVANGVLFIKALTPAIVILMFSSGDHVSAGSLEFWLFFLLEVMSHVIEYIFIPLVCARLSLSAADSIFDGIRLKGLSELIGSVLNFSLGLMLTVFTGFITINRVAASVGDAAAGKTVKFTVSNAVPIVGKIISDSADLVISFSHVIKTAFGVFGIIGVVLIFLAPVVRIGARLLVLKLTAALSETLGNTRLTGLLSSFASAATYIFSINICVCVFMVVSLGLTVVMGAK